MQSSGDKWEQQYTAVITALKAVVSLGYPGKSVAGKRRMGLSLKQLCGTHL